MIFLGDIACPPERVADFNKAVEKLDVLDNEIVVVNLEAVMLFGRQPIRNTLFNHEAVLDNLQRKAKKIIVSLANNHMYDYPDAIIPTVEFLEKRDIGVFGLYDSEGNINPYEYEDEENAYALFGHCWNLYTATNPNRKNNVRIVDSNYGDFLKTVESYIDSNPSRKVYCFMHWNYDLEYMPFPMYAKFSHDLIDAGVAGVIGSHSHVVHHVEIYKGRPIAYCLGNFYLPSGIYFDGNLNYPDDSKTTIGINININNNNTDVLRFETDKKETVRFVCTESADCFQSLLTSDIERYTKIFRKKRSKKILVPVFESYSGAGYELKNLWAIQRVRLIKQLSKLLHK